MKRKIAIAILGTVFCFGFATESPAQTIQQRQPLERARIRQGVRNGSLTRQEAKRLAAEQAKIRKDERKAARGGVTAAERKRLKREVRRANRDIARQKHDRQNRK